MVVLHHNYLTLRVAEVMARSHIRASATVRSSRREGRGDNRLHDRDAYHPAPLHQVSLKYKRQRKPMEDLCSVNAAGDCSSAKPSMT
jgi:hypothetical protein